MRIRRPQNANIACAPYYLEKTQQELLGTIGVAINQYQAVQIELQSNAHAGEKVKKIVYPYRVVYIDGELELICQNKEYLFVEQFLVSDITEVELKPLYFRPEWGHFLIEEFLSAGRAITGNEIRLVLKVTTQEFVNLGPSFHYFSSPYTAINSHGQIIWAASVELSWPLFEWLAQIRDQIEILDPPLLENELELYIEFMKQKNGSE